MKGINARDLKKIKSIQISTQGLLAEISQWYQNAIRQGYKYQLYKTDLCLSVEELTLLQNIVDSLTILGSTRYYHSHHNWRWHKAAERKTREEFSILVKPLAVMRFLIDSLVDYTRDSENSLTEVSCNLCGQMLDVCLRYSSRLHHLSCRSDESSLASVYDLLQLLTEYLALLTLTFQYSYTTIAPLQLVVECLHGLTLRLFECVMEEYHTGIFQSVHELRSEGVAADSDTYQLQEGCLEWQRFLRNISV